MQSDLSYAWLVPLFPLLGFLINGFFGGKLPKAVSGTIGTLAVFASFGVAIFLFLHVTGAAEGAKQATVYLAPWLSVPSDPQGLHFFRVNYELLIDPLSCLMMLIITGIGGLIHLYSTAYMAADKGYSRFFTYLNLFIFFMLLLVMGNNMLLMFVGWEGVGLCSYLLIGFFYEKKSAGDAAKKAFIVNRIGDVGVLVGMFMLFAGFGTLDFVTGASGVTGITQAAPDLMAKFTPLFVTTLLLMIFLGCTGKSAQIPLYTWLPDAMEGPTPVSALIHAATMVTAGVYLVSRTHALFVLSDTAMVTIAATGIATALFAATIGLMQTDIKRVLAYSTVSQLGYMFAACGAGVFAAGMFHVMTHAFFKACLFLGSGSVIHAIEHGMHAKDAAHGDADHADAAHAEHSDTPNPEGGPDPHDPQDMRNMGGLFPRIRITAVTMIAATLAIAGIYPFAGYFSKDEILWRTWQTADGGNYLFWGVGVLTALLTAFYMFRLVMKTFFGPPRTDAARNAHESSPAITIPLVILAVLSSITGWAVLKFDTFAEYLSPSLGALPAVHNENMEGSLGLGLLVGIVLSIAYAVVRYRSSYRTAHPGEIMEPGVRADHRLFSPGWYNWAILNKYFVDEAYNFWFVKLGKRLSNWLYKTFDLGLVDGIVNGVGAFTGRTGQVVRRTQSGFVRNYAFSMVVGILLVLIGCLAGLSHAR